ncbi:hypothetical protein K440DRAFT_618672 [Wilcoxina mikolae CBS 423.85]|nr:hypothetical protein K440DRAFT_618672 [Wilcoxina mikolae CBS 423.85]
MPKTHSIPTKIKDDYLILPLQLPATQSFNTPAIHYLYLRRHQPRIPTPDDSHSLFAVNVPVDATESHLRTLFSTLEGGRVESVHFEHSSSSPSAPLPPPPFDTNNKKRKRPTTTTPATTGAEIKTWDRLLHTSGATAIIRFVDSESCVSTLRRISSARKTPPTWPFSSGGALGIARYTQHHRLRFPSSAHLQASVDSFVAAFGEAEEEARRAAARRRQEPDADGFVTVTRGGRVKPARQDEAKRVLEEKEAKKKKGELSGFYRFQVREDKKKRQQELLAKFEEDRKRVEERKKGRRFIPE